MGTALTSATEQIAEAFKVARDWSRNSGNQSAGGGLQAEPEPEEWAGLTALVEAAGLDAKAISEQKEIEAETAQAVLGSDELINQLAFEIAAAMQGMVLAGSVIFPPVLPCVVAVYGPPISPIYGGGGITTFIPTLDMMLSLIHI